MRDGRSSELVQSWIDKLGREFANTDPHGARQETAYAQWFDEQAQRREGRRERLAEASPFVPLPLWFVLGIGASLTIAYMVRPGRPARGAPYPVDTDRLRHRPRDRGPARGLFPRPPVRGRERQHRADRDAPDAHAHRPREPRALRRARHPPLDLTILRFTSRTASISQDGIHDHLRRSLSKFKQPAEITILDDSPGTRVGKIDKPTLRRSIAEDR